MKPLLLLIASASCLFFAACTKDDKTCPTGLTGANCDETIIPKSIIVKRVEVSGVPPYRANGIDWDNTEAGLERNPDLTIRIKPNVLGVPFINGGNQIPNADLLGSQSYSIGFHNPLNPEPYKLKQDLTGFFALGVFDYDYFGSTVTYEEMDYILFKFYEPGRAFPKALLVNSSQVSYELELEYEY